MWDDIEDINDTGQPGQRVLVVVVPSQRDWDLVKSEHWYRIPVARAPLRLSANYLAFYHTGKLEHRWTIAQYAAVRSYRVCKRRELLPNEPNHTRADQAYYRVDLGPLEPLPQPIPSIKLRRITFIATTLERLLQAREVSDLWEREKHNDQLRRVMALREWWWRLNY